MTTPSTPPEVGHVYNFAANIGDGAQFTITGNLGKNMNQADMRAEISRAEALVLYLRAKFELPVLQGMLAQAKARLADHELVIKQILASKAPNKEHLARAQETHKNLAQDVETGEKKIAEAQQRISG